MRTIKYNGHSLLYQKTETKPFSGAWERYTCTNCGIHFTKKAGAPKKTLRAEDKAWWECKRLSCSELAIKDILE